MAASVALRLKFGRLVSLFGRPRSLTALHLRKNCTRYHFLKEWKFNESFLTQKRIINATNVPCVRGFSSSPDSSVSSNVVQFNLSDIGEGIREVNVKEWFVKVGDRVAQFDSICEVQSDKASVTITSRYDGIITKLYHDVDDVALVGQPLVDIQLEGETEITSADDTVEKTASSDEDSESSSSSEESSEEDETESSKVLATPAVRHMASQKKVSLEKVTGSGKHGRILKEDVLAYVKARDAEEARPVPITSEPLAEPLTRGIPSPLKVTGVPGDRTEVITGIRKAMVKAMTLSNSIPHFCFSDEIDLTKLVDEKQIFKDAFQKYGVKFSYTSLFIKAASVALSEFPLLNSTVDSECKTITYKGTHNIGIAMDTPGGLIVPNIKNVAQLSLLEVASELNRLVQLGASGKLGPSDLTGGTFTLSNIGMIGGTYTKPVIFAPEVVIGALGSIKKLPRYDEDEDIVAANVMNVSWSADHRVVDGATLARFSNLWKSYLENPTNLLLHMK